MQFPKSYILTIDLCFAPLYLHTNSQIMKTLRLLMALIGIMVFADVAAEHNSGKKSVSSPLADSLIAYGKQLVRTNPDSAIVLLKVAMQFTDSNSLTRAAAYRQMSNAYFFKDNFEKAVEVNNLAIGIRKRNPMDSANMAELAVLYYNNALNLQNSNNYLSAIRSAEQAMPMFEKNGNDYYLSIVYDLASSLCQQTGDTYRAQDYAIKELALCEKIGDTVGISYTYDLLAAICSTTEQFDQQLEWQKKSLYLRMKMDDIVRVAQSYNNIGNTYINIAGKTYTDNFVEADIFNSNDHDNDKIDVLRLDTALMYLKESLRLKKNFTEAEARQTEVSVSETYESNKYWRENLLGKTLKDIALAYYWRNEGIDSCLAYGQMAADYLKKTQQTYEYAQLMIVLGQAYATANNLNAAQHYLEEAIKLSNQGDGSFKSIKQQANSNLANVLFRKGDYRKAFLVQWESVRLKDSLANESNVREMTLMESRYEFNKQRTADSINRYHENLRIEAEHQSQLKHKQFQMRVFACIVLVFLFIAVVLFFYYKTIKENEENKLRNKALEVERSLLRTQMNPHFIFNALNSVQNFIVSNNTQDAVRFLSKFAKLMRMILNNSMVQSVTLSDEMQSLSLYLDLERARFGNRFNYRIDIDDNVEEDLLNVPPMLVQPFIENAIIHGLMHKTDGEGLISIKISENDSTSLICQITDNGVGRKAAAELEKNNERKHKSVGMQLTRDRLRDLNIKANAEMSCVITDLEDDAGNALGTQVTIIIPITDGSEG